MFICIAGKNDIAVNVLLHIIKYYKEGNELGVVCNAGETGINGWQKSLRFFAKKNHVREYSLEEMYTKKQLIFLSLEYDRLVKPERFLDARLYNIHFSLLPKYKGMYTSAIPILNGEKEVGVTLHKIDNGIDTGDIIAQREFELSDTCTCKKLYSQYIDHGVELINTYLETIISDKVSAVRQTAQDSTYYSKTYLDYSNIEIDLIQTAEGIRRQIMAYTFREYQLPVVYDKKIIGIKITENKSNRKSGVVLEENDSEMILSTVDYNVILYFDRLQQCLDACACGNLLTVKEICNVKEHIDDVNYYGQTPLMLAIRFGHINIVRYLIDKGANIQVVDNKGKNILMYAAECFTDTGSREILNILLKMKIDKGVCDYEGHDFMWYINK